MGGRTCCGRIARRLAPSALAGGTGYEAWRAAEEGHAGTLSPTPVRTARRGAPQNAQRSRWQRGEQADRERIGSRAPWPEIGGRSLAIARRAAELTGDR